MRTKALPSFLLFLLLFFMLAAGALYVNSAAANPALSGGKPLYAKVSIEHPQNGLEYNSSKLSFTIKTNRFLQSGFDYSDSHCLIILDSTPYEFKEIFLVGQTTISNDAAYKPYTELTLIGNTSLSNFANLAKGNHIVEVKYATFSSWDSTAISQFILTEDISLTPTPSPTPSPKPTPVPPIQNSSSNIILDTPKETYRSTLLVVNFSVETNWSNYSFYYSLDKSNLKPAENVTVISIESIPDAYELKMNRTVLSGSLMFSNMSSGWHSITLIQLGHFRGNSQYGNNMNSASSQFFVDTESIAQISSANDALDLFLPLLAAIIVILIVIFSVILFFSREVLWGKT
jgi:hypothetical protein